MFRNNCDLSNMATMIVRFKNPVKCDLCIYTFNNSRALEQHMESEHDTQSVEPNFSCKYCPKIFRTESESLDHFVMDHNMEKADAANKDSEEKKETMSTTTGKLDYILNEFKK